MDKKKVIDRYEVELEELRATIKGLQDKLHENEIANELELYNAKERLTKLHAEDLQARDAAKEQLRTTLEAEIADLKKSIELHGEEM